MYKKTNSCIGLLHVEELLEIFLYRLYAEKGIVHSNLEQPVDELNVKLFIRRLPMVLRPVSCHGLPRLDF